MADIALVGEAWGEQEERERAPFVGPAGYELTRMLEEAGIRRSDCFLTNVFNFRPRGNEIDTLCVPKKDDRSGLPPIRAGKYLRGEFLQELDRLASELRELRPHIVVALGNTASWALLHNSGISKIRGSIAEAQLVPGIKVLPTFHPAAVLRQWEIRHVTVLDLIKAKRESAFPEIIRPHRTIFIEPSLRDLEEFYNDHLRDCRQLAFDIETAGNQITCIGFAPTTAIALVIPFVDPRKTTGSYWSSLDEEREAWSFVRRVLAQPCPKVAQNGLYDIQFLWRQYGIPVVNFEHDTMLLHHALQPESQKGLGFLGSVYTNESSWKLLNRRDTTIKRDL